jgi:lipoyl(octanoyl) transferase
MRDGSRGRGLRGGHKYLMKGSRQERNLLVCDLGLTRYEDAWKLQQRIFQSRASGEISDVLLLTEHAHVYTIGKSAKGNHLLASKSELEERGIDVFHIDRGGDITYHGPGQLVAYPILDLNHHYLDVHRYLRDLEETIIRALATYGIQAERDPPFTGVWVNGRKVAAIGVKVSRWITMHGIAINVGPDLSYFDGIVPCGIPDRHVTSIERILSRRVEAKEFSKRIISAFEEVFSVQSVPVELDFIIQRIDHHRVELEECLK